MPNHTAIIDWSPILQYMAAAQVAREEFADSYLASLDELADLHANLEAWQQELAQEQTRLQEERAHIREHAIPKKDSIEIDALQERLVVAEQEYANAQREIKEHKDQAHNLRQQCESLENELELVRARTAELSTNLTEERHKMSRARAEWTKEIQQMRHMLEQQTVLSIPEPNASSSRSHPASGDVVVGSVLAQFDKIRQQRADRRGKQHP